MFELAVLTQIQKVCFGHHNRKADCMNWINRFRRLQALQQRCVGCSSTFCHTEWSGLCRLPTAPRCVSWKLAAGLAMFLLTATLGWSKPVPGSLDVHWNEGALDCSATPQDPLQVHNYEPQTFILRQSPCADFEANFIYLLIGSDKALLIDTGAVADPKAMPLAKIIFGVAAR